MWKPLAALALMVATLAVGEGCAPVPLPHYAAYPPKRDENCSSTRKTCDRRATTGSDSGSSTSPRT